MKSIKYAILALGMILGGIKGAVAQTVDEIVQKHIAAIGGAEAWKKVNTVKMIASANAAGTEIPITLTIKDKKGMKVEFTVSGMTGYTIITDKGGWNYAPFGGQTKAEAMPEEAVKQAQDQLDLQGALLDYKAKGTKITYLGKDDVEGTECYKLKLVFASGKEETRYFDASNYYHIKSVSKVTANGKEVEMAQTFSNFQKLPEGIVFYMSMDGGMGGTMNIKTIEINKPVDESIFVPKS